MISFDFPVGYHNLHKTKIIDYQLNRWYSLGYADLDDMKEAAANINTLDDWKDVMIGLAEKALADGRLLNGTFYFRAAEFFTERTDPDKKPIYEKFIDLFYNHLFVAEPIERFTVPFESGYLPGYKLPAQGDLFKGHLVIHGGFDSFIEELFSVGTYFANLGYEVVMFEGPGQGAALREYGLPLTYEWEKPTSAILDAFELDDVILLGFSMGGWMCFRAAAYEPRIKRVIASSIAYDYMKIPPKAVADFARWLLKHRQLMLKMTDWKMKLMPQEKWGVDNLMYITRKDNALDASNVMLSFNEQNLKSELVEQDVLILTGAEDHFIPMKLHHLQVEALANANSITERIFTRADQGQNHCQVGNIGLALQMMSAWMTEKERVPA